MLTAVLDKFDGRDTGIPLDHSPVQTYIVLATRYTLPTLQKESAMLSTPHQFVMPHVVTKDTSTQADVLRIDLTQCFHLISQSILAVVQMFV